VAEWTVAGPHDECGRCELGSSALIGDLEAMQVIQPRGSAVRLKRCLQHAHGPIDLAATRAIDAARQAELDRRTAAAAHQPPPPFRLPSKPVQRRAPAPMQPFSAVAADLFDPKAAAAGDRHDD